MVTLNNNSSVSKTYGKNRAYKNLTVKTLLDFRTHLGVKFSFRDPYITEYVYGLNISDNIIFNSKQSLSLLRRTLKFVSFLRDSKSQILFVGTQGDFAKITKFIGETTQQPYVSTRWIKGLLTNWENLSLSIKFYHLFLKRLSKSKRSKQKTYENFYGLRFLKELPAAIFLVNLSADREIISEAKKLNIPVIAIVDGNESINLVDYPLLGNHSSLVSVFFYVYLIKQVLFNK